MLSRMPLRSSLLTPTACLCDLSTSSSSDRSGRRRARARRRRTARRWSPARPWRWCRCVRAPRRGRRRGSGLRPTSLARRAARSSRRARARSEAARRAAKNSPTASACRRDRLLVARHASPGRAADWPARSSPASTANRSSTSSASPASSATSSSPVAVSTRAATVDAERRRWSPGRARAPCRSGVKPSASSTTSLQMRGPRPVGPIALASATVGPGGEERPRQRPEPGAGGRLVVRLGLVPPTRGSRRGRRR